MTKTWWVGGDQNRAKRDLSVKLEQKYIVV